MRILAVCGMGLGTSLILKMNIQSALRELGVTGVEVAHGDLASLACEQADLIVVAQDLQANCEKYGRVVAISGVMNKADIKAKLAEALQGRPPQA
jgi:ascorbate PTS system EIIB component